MDYFKFRKNREKSFFLKTWEFGLHRRSKSRKGNLLEYWEKTKKKNGIVILRTDAYERSDEKIVKNLWSEGLKRKVFKKKIGRIVYKDSSS